MSTLKDTERDLDQTEEIAKKYEGEAKANGQSDPNEAERRNVASKLVELTNDVEFIHDQDDKCYALVKKDGVRQTFQLGTRGFESWLAREFYMTHESVTGAQALADATNTLKGKAVYEGECREVFLRSAKDGDSYLIDLGTEDWSAVRVDSTGWEIVTNPSVVFRRTQTTRPLPIPEYGGDIRALVNVVNVASEDIILIAAYIIECFRPDTPYPVLEFTGEQGSGKSETQDRLRDLIDPNKANLRTEPGNTETIFTTAAQNLVCSFNNLSHLTVTAQDAFCNLSTGGGYAKRKLYTDMEEVVEDIQRPIMLNGIGTIVTQQDLVDRTIRLRVPPIPPDKMKEKRVMDREFEEAKPFLFGALLDLFADALQRLPNVKLERLPRMADFAMLGEAVRLALGDERPFIDIYDEKRRDSSQNALEGSPVCEALREMIEKSGEFDDTVGDLFTELKNYKSDHEHFGWPRHPRGLGDALRRNMPALRDIGIEVSFGERTNRGWKVLINKVGLQRSQRAQSTRSDLVEVNDVPF